MAQPSATIQRIRIGLTGLGFVFLLVLLGAVFGQATEDVPPGGVAVNLAAPPGNEVEAAEPLAELGVTPGGSPEPANDAGNAVAP
ncbi:MAG: hypothetical protein AVDCRST_MAG39-1845 [uncultured Sphingomonadaceae bacterium]|uniref:Uncharacterized protein n=1 Tax=uncultured Sphingomonadaceae bacterium TaxID=169976 RepID=A0A6J4SY99_9SPHN|nr:MAG: hypothetical protein AVDCRST_MAG39-1845 [uncultured Sphingomonadaceae bacterium]